MAYTDIAGNPNNYPANVRAANGSDARNASTEQAGISDLADRTAWLRNLTNRTSYASMVGLTGMAEGTRLFVASYGWYVYTATTPGSFEAPYVVQPTSGPGAWYSELLLLLFGGTTPPFSIAETLLTGTALAGLVDAIRGAQAFVPIIAMKPLDTNWTYGQGGSPVWQQNATTVYPLDGEVDLSRAIGMYVADVYAYIIGSATDTDLPAGMPTLTFSQVSASGATTVLGSKTDTISTLGAYKVYHAIHLSYAVGDAPLISTFRYVVRVAGETSTNSNPGLFVNSIYLNLRATA